MLLKRAAALKQAPSAKNSVILGSCNFTNLNSGLLGSGVFGKSSFLLREFAVSEKLVANLNSFSNRVRTRKSLLDI